MINNGYYSETLTLVEVLDLVISKFPNLCEALSAKLPPVKLIYHIDITLEAQMSQTMEV